jgi:hypothetical protein
MAKAAAKVKFRCPECKCKLLISSEQAGGETICEKCQKIIRIPLPGLRRLPFALRIVFISIVFVIFERLVNVSFQNIEIYLFLYFLEKFVKLEYVIERGKNIGFYNWKSILISLVPFGEFYLMTVPEGSFKDRNKQGVV